MFTITKNDINSILRDYRINAECSSLTELQRYYYEKEDPTSKQVRVIVRVDLVDGRSLVVRFKNEDDAPQDVLGKENKLLFTVDAPMRLSVMEVDGNRAIGLIKTAFYCKKNGISLARVLLNQL